MTIEERARAVKDACKRSGLTKYIGPLGGYRGPLYNENGSKNLLFRFYVIFTDLAIVVNNVTVGGGALRSESILELSLVGFPFFVMILSMYLSLYSGYKNVELTDLLILTDKDPQPENLIEEVEASARYIYYFGRSLACSQILSMQVYCTVIPISNEIFDQYFKERTLPIPSIYPCDWKTSSSCYLMIVSIYFFGATYANSKIVSFNEMFFAIMTRQIALFRHLRYYLSKILQTIQVDNDGTIIYSVDKQSDHAFIKKQLKLWVQHHQNVMAQYDRVHNWYSLPLFVHFALITLALTCTAYAVSDDSLGYESNLLCSGFLVGEILQLSYLCRMGDRVTIETNELTLAFTGAQMSLFDAEELKIIKIILTRLNKPSVMRAVGVYPLNTVTLRMLIQGTYSYYTMLKKMG